METRFNNGLIPRSPKKYFEKGDPYHCYCHKTTRLLKEKSRLDIPIMTTFQSRFGPDEWLQPYTDKTLEELPGKEGKKENSGYLSRICFGLCRNFRRNNNRGEGKLPRKWR